MAWIFLVGRLCWNLFGLLAADATYRIKMISDRVEAAIFCLHWLLYLNRADLNAVVVDLILTVSLMCSGLISLKFYAVRLQMC